MQSRALVVTILAACSVDAPATEQSTSAATGHERVIVQLDAGPADVEAAAAQMRAAGGKVTQVYSIISGFAAELPAPALAMLRNNPRVKLIEPDITMTTSTIHTTTLDLDRVDQRVGRNGTYDDRNLTGAGIHVYVVDTGLRATHQEFARRVGTGFTAVTDGQGTNDCNGHGTHVASTILGTSFGMAKSAIVHPVRVLGCSGSGSVSQIISGINFAVNSCKQQTGRCVINLSLGGGASSTLDSAVVNAVNNNIPVVVAAGNENQNACNVSPARVAAAITVAAITDTDAKAAFSNYGSCVDLFAPGTSVRGATYTSDTGSQLLDGTSMAAPHVAGAIAQYLQSHPSASAAGIHGALVTAATPGCVTGGNGSPNLILFDDFTKPGDGLGCGSSGGGDGGTIDSCSGRCGTFTQGASCQCDSDCIQFGDCCNDAADVCEVATCTGKCGEFENGAACQCDSQCAQFGDCCSDLAQVCQ